MDNGLYKVSFSGPYGTGDGVIVIEGDTYYGGDSGIAYAGKIQEINGGYTVTLKTMRHSGVGQSVLGADAVNVTLTGHSTGPGEATLTLPLPQGQQFRADLRKLPL